MNNYINPIKKHGDFADPFVNRYNGRYYLYATNQDVRCWSSTDLIDWIPEGATISPEEFPGLVPFAPEVVYWNGAFYMYTSPHGYGHFVLKSDSPTGPFEKISDNVAHNIDGSIFIDDDGEWYFYWADDSGILGCKMKSPTEFGEPVNTGAYMYGWTEGPYVLKQNGKYYMTYTGNHYLSSGYRINAAVSDHPLIGYKDDEMNPIVIHTEGKNIGLGHSCTVLGPDLKSYYMVYHNINPDASRDLNIDYQSWHGLSTKVYGPTRSQQISPKAPDFSDYVEDNSLINWRIIKGTWERDNHFYQVSEGDFICVTNKELENTGVVEANLKFTGNKGRYGVIFGWLDKDNYYKLVFSSKSKEIQLIKVDMNKEHSLVQSILPDDFDKTALHCLRIVCDGTSLVLYIDNRKQMETVIQSAKGRVGYFATEGGIVIGFTGFSNGTALDAEKEFYKPIPGGIPVCTALGDNWTPSSEGSISLTKSRQLLYHLNIESSDEYAIDLFGRFLMDTQWKITVDGEFVTDKSFPMNEHGVLSIHAKLPEGLHTLGLILENGQAELSRIGLYKVNPLLHDEEKLIAKFGSYGKQLWGEDGWSNYRITAKLKVTPESENGHAGVMFRASEPSEGGEGNDPVLGTNFFKGYFLGLSGTHIILSKHAYDEQILVMKECSINLGETQVVSIDVKGDTYSIFIDTCSNPIIEYHDALPYTHGRIGIRTKNAIVEGSIVVRSN